MKLKCNKSFLLHSKYYKVFRAQANFDQINIDLKSLLYYIFFMRFILNVPNSLSILRMMLIIPIFILIIYSTPGTFCWLIIVYFFSIFFDFLDGYIARRFSMETALGRILDPVADKFLMFFVLIALILKTDFPVWIAIPIFVRDFLILLASFFIYKKNKEIKSSITIGKIAFGSLSFLIFLYIVGINSGSELDLLKKFVAVFTLNFLLWSWIEYLFVYLRET